MKVKVSKSYNGEEGQWYLAPIPYQATMKMRLFRFIFNLHNQSSLFLQAYCVEKELDTIVEERRISAQNLRA
jgi:hypothetical protein